MWLSTSWKSGFISNRATEACMNYYDQTNLPSTGLMSNLKYITIQKTLDCLVRSCGISKIVNKKHMTYLPRATSMDGTRSSSYLIPTYLNTLPEDYKLCISQIINTLRLSYSNISIKILFE